MTEAPIAFVRQVKAFEKVSSTFLPNVIGVISLPHDTEASFLAVKICLPDILPLFVDFVLCSGSSDSLNSGFAGKIYDRGRWTLEDTREYRASVRQSADPFARAIYAPTV